jgi:predicted  nucleic acid-binding Zn-ribbon protein
MSLHRRRGFAACVTAIALLVGLTPLALAGNNDPEAGGSTEARLKILDLELTNVPAVGDVGAALGIASGDATTFDRPFASIALDGLRVGDQRLAAESVTSDDADGSRKVDVPFGAAGVDGALTIAELAASATEDSASSTLGGLGGSLTLDALGLTSNFGGQGIDSDATAKMSTSDVGVDIGPVGLQLGDLLPEELLEALPFSKIVALAGDLDLDVVGALRDARALLRQINDQVDDIQATIDELADAEETLDALISGNSEISALQDEVDAAAADVAAATAALQEEQATLNDLTAQKSALETQLAGCTVGCDVLQAELDALNASIETQEADVAAAQERVATATTELQDAQAALDAAVAAAGGALQEAGEAVDQLQAELENLLDELEDLLAGLPDLDALIQGAIDALQGAPLVSVRRLSLGVDTLADASQGVGNATCSAGGVNVLGTQLGAMSCSALTDEFDELESGIFALLSDLPVAGSLPRPTVGGLSMTETGSTGPNADGRTASAASITALRLGVPSVALDAVVDTLVADLTQQLEDIAGSTPLTPALDELIASVLQQLGSLPTGALLDGLRTVGVEAAVGGVESASEFVPAAGAARGNDPAGETKPDDPEASDPQQRAPLPFTGATHLAAFVALALLAMVAGTGLRLVPQMSGATGSRVRGS